MNITKHNPNCRSAAWQLQMRIIDGEEKYLARCLNCGATSPVTDTEARNWNQTPDVIPIGMPIVELPNSTT